VVGNENLYFYIFLHLCTIAREGELRLITNRLILWTSYGYKPIPTRQTRAERVSLEPVPVKNRGDGNGP
jgi:hypothetical protein